MEVHRIREGIDFIVDDPTRLVYNLHIYDLHRANIVTAQMGIRQERGN